MSFQISLTSEWFCSHRSQGVSDQFAFKFKSCGGFKLFCWPYLFEFEPLDDRGTAASIYKKERQRNKRINVHMKFIIACPMDCISLHTQWKYFKSASKWIIFTKYDLKRMWIENLFLEKAKYSPFEFCIKWLLRPRL